MRHISNRFMITAGISFVIFVVLAFTPLAIFPMILAVAATGWSGIYFVLLFTSAPIVGFVLLLLTPREKWMIGAAELTALFGGAIFGSVVGLKLAEGA